MKKKISVFLVVMMLVTTILPASVFAAESEMPDGIPEYAEKHTVVVEVPPASDENSEGISPYLWEDEYPELVTGQNVTVATFSTTKPYAAFETSAVVISGTATGTYFTGFYDDGSLYKWVHKYPDGEVSKCDYIALDNQSTYSILVANSSNATIRATIIYYTW